MGWTTYQESRGAVQQAADPGYETSVEEGGELRRNPPRLRRMEQAAHNIVLTWQVEKERDEGEQNKEEVLFVEQFSKSKMQYVLQLAE